MKKKVAFLTLLLLIISAQGYSQEKSKKEIKEEKKIEEQKRVESMIDSREFVFTARTALPSGMRSIDLTTNPNYVRFKPDMIDSDMPFFGRAYSAIGYGSDTGLKFKGKPEKFTVTRSRKKFQVDVVVNDQADNFSLFLSVGLDGNASLSIVSNKRSSISYQGEISSYEPQK